MGRGCPSTWAARARGLPGGRAGTGALPGPAADRPFSAIDAVHLAQRQPPRSTDLLRKALSAPLMHQSAESPRPPSPPAELAGGAASRPGPAAPAWWRRTRGPPASAGRAWNHAVPARTPPARPYQCRSRRPVRPGPPVLPWTPPSTRLHPRQQRKAAARGNGAGQGQRRSRVLEATRQGPKITPPASDYLTASKNQAATTSAGDHRRFSRTTGRHDRDIGDYLRWPAVSPDWTWRWKTRYARSTGSIAIATPANSPL